MATQIKVWEISGSGITPVEDASLASTHLEQELESWITQSPSILGADLLVIDRQREVAGVGRLDLLCMDSSGQFVIVELKRDLSPREAVAQALDYASWLDSASEDEILGYAQEFLKRPLEDAFREHFSSQLPEVLCENHRIMIVASRLDASAERIVNYLSQRHGVDINAIFFKYSKLSDGKEILVRSVLVAEEVRQARAGRGRKTTLPELLALAEERGVTGLVEVCRKMNTLWGEEPQNTYGGSFRYWAIAPSGKGKMVFGVNLAGGRMDPPRGQLDVWVPTKSLAEVTGVDEAAIRKQLKTGHPLLEAQPVDCIIRLKSQLEADHLVEQLRQWASSQGQPTKPNWSGLAQK